MRCGGSQPSRPEDAAWRTQLLGLAPQYLAAVNQFTSQNVRRTNFVLPDELRQRAQS